MKQLSILYIDDDGAMANTAGISIKMHFRDRNIATHILASEEQVESYIANNSKTERPILAVVDLWMISKTTLKPNTEAGFQVIAALRRLFPSIFITVVSAHINKDAIAILNTYSNIAIVEKPIPTTVLIGKIDETLTALGVQ